MQINIDKKHFWILASLIVLMIGVFVIATDAIGSGADSEGAFGHDLSQIDFNLNIEEYDYGIDESIFGKDLSCGADSIAIGCSVYKEGENAGDEDVGFCRVNEEKGGCLFSYDIAGQIDTTSVKFLCYCLK